MSSICEERWNPINIVRGKHLHADFMAHIRHMWGGLRTMRTLGGLLSLPINKLSLSREASEECNPKYKSLLGSALETLCDMHNICKEAIYLGELN